MRLILLIALATLSVAVLAADKVQPLNIKTGRWEVTTIIKSGSEMPIPAGLLEKLTPEQRARVEDRTKAKSSEAQTVTRKYCLIGKEQDKGATFGQDKKSCSHTIIDSTGNKAKMRIECPPPGRENAVIQTLQIEVIDPEQVKGTIGLAVDAGRAEAQTSTFTARWIGPTCSTNH
jgi:hypothetical protein